MLMPKSVMEVILCGGALEVVHAFPPKDANKQAHLHIRWHAHTKPTRACIQRKCHYEIANMKPYLRFVFTRLYSLRPAAQTVISFSGLRSACAHVHAHLDA